MYAEISAAIESAKMLAELLKAAKSLTNYNEFVSAVSEVNTKLMDATAVALASQEEQARLSNLIGELKKELVQLKDWENKARDYTLKEVASGIFAYVYTPLVQTSKPRHWVCAKCFEERKCHVLQRQRPPSYTCPNCGAKIHPYKEGGLVSIDDPYQ